MAEYYELKVEGRMKTYDNHSSVEKDTTGSLQSARVIVPLVVDLLNPKPKRVVDIGCGLGAWLKACQEHGIDTIQGMDGTYLNRSNLFIDGAYFRSVNLREPLSMVGKWDMAICLEVVEHLSPKAGASLIDALTRSAPVVLFSAAVPGQTGRGHINEQWPAYWKHLFEARGFRRLDPIRRHIWQNRRVEWWYRQNIYLYVSADALANSERLRLELEMASELDDEWIHIHVLPHYRGVRGLLRELPQATWQAIRHRVGAGRSQGQFRTGPTVRTEQSNVL